MNWKIILWPVAIVAEIASLAIPGAEKITNWIADREYGDPKGKWYQTREQARRDAED